MIIYTDFMPARFSGYNLGFVTLIRPSARNDKGLHAHEEVHRKQFLNNPLMGLWYLFSRPSRMRYEAEAYRAQLVFAPESKDLFAWYLSHNYSLQITTEQAEKLLE